MPEIAPEINSTYVQVNDLRLHCLVSQPQYSSVSKPQKTIVFLHGFPEHSGVWHKQLYHFGKGYRAIALDLPGYNLSQAPRALEEFSVPSLVSIIADFIRTINDDFPITIVAHDWGGALAWPLANRYPDLIDRLVIINAAHPSTFTREMIENQNQRLLSDYIHDFLQPQAEQDLAEDNFAALKAHSIDKIKVPLSKNQVKEYESAWSQPNAIANMLNYYRAMPQLFPREAGEEGEVKVLDSVAKTPEKPLNSIKVPKIVIKTPTLVLWGEHDQAFDIGVLHGIDEYIEDYQELRFADASHWLHHEKSEEVNNAIGEFLYK